MDRKGVSATPGGPWGGTCARLHCAAHQGLLPPLSPRDARVLCPSTPRLAMLVGMVHPRHPDTFAADAVGDPVIGIEVSRL